MQNKFPRSKSTGSVSVGTWFNSATRVESGMYRGMRTVEGRKEGRSRVQDDRVTSYK